MIKPCKIICHNDLDGGVSAICIINHIKQKYGFNAQYELWFGSYKNVDMYVERLLDDPNKYERVFIADIHVHPELAKEFPDNWILLDHHASASNLKDIKNCIIDDSGKVCGAAMCYKYLLKDEGLEYRHLAKLVAIANDYDLWVLRLPKNLAKNLNFLYYFYWGEKFVERFQMGFDKFNQEETDFLIEKWKQIKNSFKTTTFMDALQDTDPELKGKFCVIPVSSNKDGEVNELCEYALNELHYQVVMFINSVKRKISIRISKDANEKGLHVGNFNTELQIGGGHPTAGGASYFDETQLEMICTKYTEQIINLGI